MKIYFAILLFSFTKYLKFLFEEMPISAKLYAFPIMMIIVTNWLNSKVHSIRFELVKRKIEFPVENYAFMAVCPSFGNDGGIIYST